MTQTFGINASNDIYRGTDGNLVVLTGIYAVAAACKSIAQARLKEMVLEQGRGQPFFEAVFNGVPNTVIYESRLRSSWLGVNGVDSIKSLAIQITNNKLAYQAVIKSIYGEVPING